ncbi:MAG: hypothetical protein ACKVHM_10040 [Pseudomonadales bacterium]
MNLIAAPQRGVLASFALLIVSMMLSAQALSDDCLPGPVPGEGIIPCP